MKRLALIVALLVPVIAFAGRSAGGTYSLPAGNPVATGTLITTAWANTTLSDIAQGLTDSLDRNGRGSMAAQLRLLDGTISAPGIGYGNETNTGWYRAGSADLRLTLTGVDRERVTSAASAPAFTWTSPQAAAGAQTDFLFNTSATRTAGNIFAITNNAANLLGLSIVNSSLDLYGLSIVARTANTGITIGGNRNAADAGSDVTINSSATRTAGNLLVASNAGVTKASIDYTGAISSPTTAKAFGTLVPGLAGAVGGSNLFNINAGTSSWTTSTLTVNFAGALPSANYVVLVTMGYASSCTTTGVVPVVTNTNASSFTIALAKPSDGTACNYANGSPARIDIVVFGT